MLSFDSQAHWAASKGLKKGDVVSIYMENKPEYIITWLGLAKIGVTSALINTNLTGKGLVHCIKISDAKLLIFGHESAQIVNDSRDLIESEYKKLEYFSYGGAVPFAQHLNPLLLEHSPQPPPRSVRKNLKSEDNWAFVYTSGTTGLPKAAIITHHRYFLASYSFAILFDVTKKDRVYLALPLYHSAGGIIGLGMLLHSNALLVIRKKFSATKFITDGLSLLFIYFFFRKFKISRLIRKNSEGTQVHSGAVHWRALQVHSRHATE